jgi:small-conductance mechanosensitive channel
MEETMLVSILLSGLAILVAWTVLDVLLHRLALRSLYAQDPQLWRSFERLNVVLIYVVTFALIASYVLTYWLLIQPKSLGAGIAFGSLLGLALGLAVAGGTYIHMPIPRALAWGWLAGGCVKGIAAGTILGALIHEP